MNNLKPPHPIDLLPSKLRDYIHMGDKQDRDFIFWDDLGNFRKKNCGKLAVCLNDPLFTIDDFIPSHGILEESDPKYKFSFYDGCNIIAKDNASYIYNNIQQWIKNIERVKDNI